MSTRTGHLRRINRRTESGTASVLILVLCLAIVGLGISGIAAARPAHAVKPKPLIVTSAPSDAVAMLAAQRQDSKVLVTGDTTPTTQTWANPNGTYSSTVTDGPVRFEQDNTWSDLDPTLSANADGTLSPSAFPEPVTFAAGGGSASSTQNLVQLGSGSTEIAWQWKGSLPTPTVAGNRATYANVRPGVDLVLEMTRTGFAQFFVVHSRPASPLSFTLPLHLGSGIDAVAQSDGSVQYQTANGSIVAHTPTPTAWQSAATDITMPTSAT